MATVKTYDLWRDDIAVAAPPPRWPPLPPGGVDRRSPASTISSYLNDLRQFCATGSTTVAGLTGVFDAQLTDVEIRAIVKVQLQRYGYLSASGFIDPAWELLLELTHSRLADRRVTVASLCSTGGVPIGAGLRWIAAHVERGIFHRPASLMHTPQSPVELTETAHECVLTLLTALADEAAARSGARRNLLYVRNFTVVQKLRSLFASLVKPWDATPAASRPAVPRARAAAATS